MLISFCLLGRTTVSGDSRAKFCQISLFCLSQVDLQLKSENGGDVSTFVLNGEWDLLGEAPDQILLLKVFSKTAQCALTNRFYVQEFRQLGTKSSTNAALPPTLTSLSLSGK